MKLESLQGKLRAGFEDYLNSQTIQPTREFSESKVALASREKSQPPIVQQYHFQKIIRPLWGKPGLAIPAIGDHPDFKDLAATGETIFCPIATLFMDIESSTRLGILFEPQEVFKIKNAFIATAIEVIQSFDGHVHRIMGDAVMAFFGGLYALPENAVLQALNAAAMIQYVVKNAIIPKLQKEGFENPFGIRIGIDYGAKASVLWASYGFPGSNEVTATSFFVDSASKLQHAAPRNSVMIGQSLRDFIDFPGELLSTKKVISDGKTIDEPFLLPNITDSEKRPINYKQYIFDSFSYLDFSPLSPHDSNSFSSFNFLAPISISVHIASEKEGPFESEYIHCGSFIEKGKWLCFGVKATSNSELRMPLRIRFEVENHGEDAEKDDNFGNHHTDLVIESNSKFRTGISHWEHTVYRGLHYMKVSIFQPSEVKFFRPLAIFIT